MTDKIIPDPPISTSLPSSDSAIREWETQLNQASELLSCASATAYECGDGLQGQQRDLAMASMYLMTQARDVINHLLDDLLPLAGTTQPEQ
jgi:hypothetical protein